jgi:small subunit ribosomal protein S16
VAVKIRLKRMGKIRVPQYRIVVVDARKKRDGRVLEEIGLYQPKEEPSLITVESERAQYWLSVGAQPSEPVAKILKITGDWQKFKGTKGTEGTLKVKEPKRDKLEIFNEALKEAGNEPKGEAVTRKASKKTEKPAKAEAKTEDAAVETPAVEAAVETPAVETPAAEAAVVEAPVVEEAAPVPADETPEGATEVAETAETAEVDAEAKKDEA